MFERHARDLLRYATQRVGEQVAEDIVAQTFLTAYEQRDRYDPGKGELLPWSYRSRCSYAVRKVCATMSSATCSPTRCVA